ncbi:MAG: hypothetical protein HQL77_18790 [Magnetococcales bacterium]|nr:hypothetical protein [Magnetococcales bacterium]
MLQLADYCNGIGGVFDGASERRHDQHPLDFDHRFGQSAWKMLRFRLVSRSSLVISAKEGTSNA